MKITEKKLPTGFRYLFSKKELNQLNNAVDIPFENVNLDGTSFTASKRSGKQLPDYQQLGRIKFKEINNQQTMDLILFGVKDTCFKNERNFEKAKEDIMHKIIRWVKKQKELIIENNLNTKVELWMSINFESTILLTDAKERKSIWD